MYFSRIMILGLRKLSFVLFVGVVFGRKINRLFCKHRPNLMFAKGVKVRPPRVIKWPKVICPSNSADDNKSANCSADFRDFDSFVVHKMTSIVGFSILV